MCPGPSNNLQSQTSDSYFCIRRFDVKFVDNKRTKLVSSTRRLVLVQDSPGKSSKLKGSGDLFGKQGKTHIKLDPVTPESLRTGECTLAAESNRDGEVRNPSSVLYFNY